FCPRLRGGNTKFRVEQNRACVRSQNPAHRFLECLKNLGSDGTWIQSLYFRHEFAQSIALIDRQGSNNAARIRHSLQARLLPLGILPACLELLKSGLVYPFRLITDAFFLLGWHQSPKRKAAQGRAARRSRLSPAERLPASSRIFRRASGQGLARTVSTYSPAT